MKEGCRKTLRVGILEIELHIPGNNSLKGKRRVIKSIKDRVRSRFNVSVAEVARHDEYRVAVLGVSAVSNDVRHLNQTLSKVVNLIEGISDAELVDYRLEML